MENFSFNDTNKKTVLAPIFTKKRPKQALFSHPNNQNASNTDNFRPQPLSQQKNQRTLNGLSDSCSNNCSTDESVYGVQKKVQKQFHFQNAPSTSAKSTERQPSAFPNRQVQNKPSQQSGPKQTSGFTFKNKPSSTVSRSNWNSNAQSAQAHTVANGYTSSSSYQNNQQYHNNSSSTSQRPPQQQPQQQGRNQASASMFTPRYGQHPTSGTASSSSASMPTPRYGQLLTRGSASSSSDAQLALQPYGHAHHPQQSASATQIQQNNQPRNAVAKPNVQSKMPSKDNHAPTSVPSPPDFSLHVLAATIQGMKHWSQYKDKTPLMFEVLGVVSSAVSTNDKHHSKQFVLKDQHDSVQCVFYEIDRKLPRITRGLSHRIDEATGNSDSWTMSFDYENLIVRCVGTFDQIENIFKCVSIRQSTNNEKKLHQACVASCDREMRQLSTRM